MRAMRRPERRAHGARPFPLLAVVPAGRERLELRGELTSATCVSLVRSLLAAERAEPEAIVLELRELTTIDAMGLRVLLDAARRARLHGRRFALAGANAAIREVLALTALDQAIEVLP
jgi:anti-sigma B factor antagonist